MAGIGFELKKLFNKRGYLALFSAYFYSSVVTVGPMIICMLLIFFVKLYLKFLGIADNDVELLTATIVYSFIFSSIITGGFAFVLSRFISDKIFSCEYGRILPSFYGSQIIVLFVSGIVGAIFYILSPLDFIYKLFAYLLFVELSMLWIEMVYISALRKYMKILKGFIFGALISIILSVILISVSGYNPITLILISITMGFFIIVNSFAIYIKNFYYHFDYGIFNFLHYVEKYFYLYIVGFFLTLAAYLHNFIFWFGHYSVVLGDTYIFCPMYDVPVFYAVLSIIPSMVIFVVSVETNFYEKYRLYYSLILNGGTIHEIKIAKKEMIDVLLQEITHIMEIQLFATFVSITAGIKFLPMIGFTADSINIFNMLVLGYYVYIITYIVILLLLYFDDMYGAAIVSSTLLGSNLIFTLISVVLGENYFGTGFFVAGFISVVVSLFRLRYFIKNIDYYSFCRQPLFVIDEESKFKKAINSVSKYI